MAVAVRSPNGVTTANTGTSNRAGNTGLTINVPSGVQNGDVMYMAIHAASSTGTFSAPGAWTVVEAQFSSTGQASSKMMVWRRVASSEPASYTITWGAAGNTGRAAAAIVAFTGVNTVTIQQAEAKDPGAGPTSTEVLPSVSPTTATMILGIAGAYTPSFGATTWTTAAMSEIADTSSANTSQSNASIQFATESVSSGATGTRTQTGSRSDLRPCGVMVALDPSNPQTATPGVLAVILTTFAPTVTAGSGTTVTPGVVALTTAAFAPTIAHRINGASPTALTLTGFAPVIRTAVVVPTSGLTLSTFAPTVSTSDHKLATPTTATLGLTTFAPTVPVTDHKTVTPATTTLTATTFAPVIALTVTPADTALTLTTFAPAVGAPVQAVPSTTSLTLTTFAPAVGVTDNMAVTPTTLSLTLTTFAPTVAATDHKTVTPLAAALGLVLFEPVVFASDYRLVTPDPAVLSLSTLVPMVKVGAPLRNDTVAVLAVPDRPTSSLSVPERATATVE